VSIGSENDRKDGTERDASSPAPRPRDASAPAPRAEDVSSRATRLAGYLGFYLFLLNLFVCLYRGEWADLRALGVFAVSLALVALGILTHRREASAVFVGRRLRLGANVTVAISLFAVGVVLANWFAARHPLAWDATRSGSFTLQERTVRILAGLPQRLPEGCVAVEVVVILGVPAEGDYWRSRLVRTLELYAAAAPAFRLIPPINPDPEPDRARVEIERLERLGVAEGSSEGVHLFLGDGHRRISWADVTQRLPRPPYLRFAAEEAITSALESLLSERPTVVGLLRGHGEKPVRARTVHGRIGVFIDRLGQQENCRLMNVDLDRGGAAALRECDVLVVAGPRHARSKREAAEILAWLDAPGAEEPGRAGHGLLLFLNPLAEPPSGFEDLLARFRVELAAERIVLSSEQTRVGVRVTTDRFLGRAAAPGTHPILRRIRRPNFRFAGACMLSISGAAGGAAGGAWVRELVAAPEKSFSLPLAELRRNRRGEILNRPGPSRAGPRGAGRSPGAERLALVLAAERELPTPGSLTRVAETARLVVVADAEFPTDLFLGIAPGNLDLAVSAVHWLAHEEVLPTFLSRVEREPVVSFRRGEARRVFWGVIVTPALIALVAAVMAAFLRRR